MKSLSRVQLFVTLWSIAHQAPLSMGFSRQEYWSGLLFSISGAIPDPGVKPFSLVSSALEVDYLPAESSKKPLSHPSTLRIVPSKHTSSEMSSYAYPLHIAWVLSFRTLGN